MAGLLAAAGIRQSFQVFLPVRRGRQRQRRRLESESVHATPAAIAGTRMALNPGPAATATGSPAVRHGLKRRLDERLRRLNLISLFKKKETMKKIYYVLIAIVSLTIANSCNKFDELNTNPDVPTSVSPELLATQVLKNTFRF